GDFCAFLGGGLKGPKLRQARRTGADDCDTFFHFLAPCFRFGPVFETGSFGMDQFRIESASQVN
ncbi:MAG: hypothetical protein ACK4NH_17320, partial [Gemmobacter sp.]